MADDTETKNPKMNQDFYEKLYTDKLSIAVDEATQNVFEKSKKPTILAKAQIEKASDFANEQIEITREEKREKEEKRKEAVAKEYNDAAFESGFYQIKNAERNSHPPSTLLSSEELGALSPDVKLPAMKVSAKLPIKQERY
jgi:hypothetical protein